MAAPDTDSDVEIDEDSPIVYVLHNAAESGEVDTLQRILFDEGGAAQLVRPFPFTANTQIISTICDTSAHNSLYTGPTIQSSNHQALAVVARCERLYSAPSRHTEWCAVLLEHTHVAIIPSAALFRRDLGCTCCACWSELHAVCMAACMPCHGHIQLTVPHVHPCRPCAMCGAAAEGWIKS